MAKYNVEDDDGTQPAKERINSVLDAIKIYQNTPGLGAMRQDLSDTNVEFRDHTMQGATGTYTFDNKKVDVAAGINRYVRKPDEIATTLVHELQHAATDKPSVRTLSDRVAAGIDGTARSLGYNAEEVKQIVKDVEAADIYYSAGEPAAHLVPARYLGPSGSKDSVRELISKYPEFTKRYAEVNSQPNRAVPKHYKGEAELSGAERVLNLIFGYQPTVDHTLPKFKDR